MGVLGIFYGNAQVVLVPKPEQPFHSIHDLVLDPACRWFSPMVTNVVLGVTANRPF